MTKLEIEQIPVLRDNYVYLVHEASSGQTAVVDPGVVDPVVDRLAARGWRLNAILSTHHHDDHVGGNLGLKERTGARVVGFGPDAARIPGIDVALVEGDVFSLGQAKARIIAVPGHTSGHIAFHFAEAAVLFPGDTLFAMGCGRLFEGSPAQMWDSLLKLRALPDETLIYCAHEYTLGNARFALTVDGNNEQAKKRAEGIEAVRAQKRPTVPSRLALERVTNPFLRADNPELKVSAGLPAEADPVEVFAEIRHRKDVF